MISPPKALDGRLLQLFTEVSHGEMRHPLTGDLEMQYLQKNFSLIRPFALLISNHHRLVLSCSIQHMG